MQATRSALTAPEDVDEALLAWFAPSGGPFSLEAYKPFGEKDLRNISSILARNGREAWSRIPRIYTVLRVINQLAAIDKFLEKGVTDVSFPFSFTTLPDVLSQSGDCDFIDAQSLVLSKALDVERRDRHRHFKDPNQVPLRKCAELGKGASGYVDMVMSTISWKEYARKLIPRGRTFRRDHEMLQTFERELGALKKLSHHHIIELIGSYTDPKYVAIIMSPVADCSLKELLQSESLIVAKQSFVRTFFGCLAAALSYLHKMEIRHKDIKPQNVLVKDNKVLITDFGICRDWSEVGQSTSTGPTSVTPQYCPPEIAQYRGRNSSADIWSLGCVFLEIWSVLAGNTSSSMEKHFLTEGGRSKCYCRNIDGISSWYDKVRSSPGYHGLEKPYQWIQNMLKEEPDHRWKARTLFDNIQETDRDEDNRFLFTGTCCKDDRDTAESIYSIQTSDGALASDRESIFVPHETVDHGRQSFVTPSGPATTSIGVPDENESLQATGASITIANPKQSPLELEVDSNLTTTSADSPTQSSAAFTVENSIFTQDDHVPVGNVEVINDIENTLVAPDSIPLIVEPTDNDEAPVTVEDVVSHKSSASLMLLQQIQTQEAIESKEVLISQDPSPRDSQQTLSPQTPQSPAHSAADTLNNVTQANLDKITKEVPQGGQYGRNLEILQQKIANLLESEVVVIQNTNADNSGKTECSSCHSNIDEDYVFALGMNYHLNCFACADCQRVLSEKFIPINNPGTKGQLPLCEIDYFRRLDLLCHDCGQALRATYINIPAGAKFHPEHFRCNYCQRIFGEDETFYEGDSKMYCFLHYVSEVVDMCPGCGTAILKQFVEVRGESWHPECYAIFNKWDVKLVEEITGTTGKDRARSMDVDALQSYMERVRKISVKVWTTLSTYHVNLESYANYSKKLFLQGLFKSSVITRSDREWVITICEIVCMASSLLKAIGTTGELNSDSMLGDAKSFYESSVKLVEAAPWYSIQGSPEPQIDSGVLSILKVFTGEVGHVLRSSLDKLLFKNLMLSEQYVGSFIDVLKLNRTILNEYDIMRLMSGYMTDSQGDHCSRCKRIVDGVCFRKNKLTTHSECLSCDTCNKPMVDRECFDCKTIPDGYTRVSAVEQLSHLLELALVRYIAKIQENANFPDSSKGPRSLEPNQVDRNSTYSNRARSKSPSPSSPQSQGSSTVASSHQRSRSAITLGENAPRPPSPGFPKIPVSPPTSSVGQFASIVDNTFNKRGHGRQSQSADLSIGAIGVTANDKAHAQPQKTYGSDGTTNRLVEQPLIPTAPPSVPTLSPVDQYASRHPPLDKSLSYAEEVSARADASYLDSVASRLARNAQVARDRVPPAPTWPSNGRSGKDVQSREEHDAEYEITGAGYLMYDESGRPIPFRQPTGIRSETSAANGRSGEGEMPGKGERKEKSRWRKLISRDKNPKKKDTIR